MVVFRALQYQEAQDFPLPFAQRHRPQVPPQPQICAARNHEGSGRQLPFDGRRPFRAGGQRYPTRPWRRERLTPIAEGEEGGQARQGLKQTSEQATGRSIEADRNEHHHFQSNRRFFTAGPYFWAATGVRVSYHDDWALLAGGGAGCSSQVGRTVTRGWTRAMHRIKKHDKNHSSRFSPLRLRVMLLSPSDMFRLCSRKPTTGDFATAL